MLSRLCLERLNDLKGVLQGVCARCNKAGGKQATERQNHMFHKDLLVELAAQFQSTSGVWITSMYCRNSHPTLKHASQRDLNLRRSHFIFVAVGSS